MEFAAEMAETIVHKVDLSMLLLQDLPTGQQFPQQLAGLKDVIMSLRAKLVDSMMNRNNGGGQDWLNKIRAPLYDIEDFVDEIYAAAATEQQRKHQRDSNSVSCFQLHSFLDFCFNYRWNARNIKDMSNKFMKLVTDNAASGMEMERRSNQEETSSLLSAAPDVERNSDTNAIIRLLADDSDSFSAILIFGKAGLGKTTVAQLVYNDSCLPSFDQKFWVWVGNELHQSSLISRISEEIIKQIPPGPSNSTPQDAIRGKKLLLVLDDVRSLEESTLASIRDSSVLASSSATKFVITTRSEQVATVNYRQIPTTRFHLGAISDDDAWRLFKKEAFNNHPDPDPDPELMNLGWEMMTRTNNVPGIIKDLASLLKGEDKRKWKALMNADFSRLIESYSPFTPGPNLAFRLLPSPLKRCFAYSAFLFQQTDNIEMHQLIHLWIAQGYIEEPALDDENKTLEEVSKGYYRALQDWSFFQDHDSDFDLAKSFAASQMLATNFDCDQDGSVLDIVPYDCNEIYHLFISSTCVSTASLVASNPNSNLETWITKLPPKLRSFVKAQGSTVTLTESICIQLFSKIGHVRALDLNSSEIKVVPASIALLEHLRYLNLSLNDFTKLPDSVTTLAKLQVLDLSFCEKLVILPRHFSRLSSLRHLYLNGCKKLTGMPVGLRKMTALQTLNVFVLGNTQKSCKLDELSSLNLKSEFTYQFASQS